MPWWSKSKTKEEDEVSHPYRPKKVHQSSRERIDQRRSTRLGADLKEAKRSLYYPSPLKGSSDSDGGPSGSVPALDLLKTSGERARRVRDEYEPVAKSPTPQHPLRRTLRPTLPGQSQRTRIVVGIDFGTTYSGAAFTILHPRDAPEDAKISLARNWKGELPGNTTSNKVPTIVAYSPAGEVAWGFDVPLHRGYRPIKWIKLLLEPDLKLRKNDIIDLSEPTRILAECGRTPVEAASDYLRCLWEHVKKQIINEHSRAVYDYAEKSIVLSVPAIWSDAAKHNTYLVAAGAGLAAEEYRLQIVSEPEAAAIAVLKDRSGRLKVGDCYVVVDAGGGTVDLTSYVLLSTAPLQLKEVVPGDGDTCGAVFLDESFRKLLRTFVGADVFDNLPPDNVARIMNDFETGTRKTFDGTDNIKYSVAMFGIPDDPRRNIEASLWKLSAIELRPVFQSIIEKTERLVRKQLQALAQKGHTPTAILLVGGFGTNHYLALRLKHLYQDADDNDDSQKRIEVLQPNIGWESIANGAVRCEILGLEGLLTLRVARVNIGLELSTGWKESEHLPEHQYECPYTGNWRADKQIFWLLRRHDQITPNHRMNYAMALWVFEDEIPATKIKIRFALVRSDAENAPGYIVPGVRKMVDIVFEWDVRKYPPTALESGKSPTGRTWYILHYDVNIVQGPAKLDFSYSVDGVKRGEAQSVEYSSLEQVEAILQPYEASMPRVELYSTYDGPTNQPIPGSICQLPEMKQL